MGYSIQEKGVSCHDIEWILMGKTCRRILYKYIFGGIEMSLICGKLFHGDTFLLLIGIVKYV